MGFFFKGRVIQDWTVLKHLLHDDPAIAKWEAGDGDNSPLQSTYDTKNIGGRVWLWTNLISGEVIITGDEGNGWSVELARGKNRAEALRKYWLKDKGHLTNNATLDTVSLNNRNTV